MQESSSVSSLLESHPLTKALLAADGAVDVLVWTPALNAADAEWHIWQTTPGAAAFVAGEPATGTSCPQNTNSRYKNLLCLAAVRLSPGVAHPKGGGGVKFLLVSLSVW